MVGPGSPKTKSRSTKKERVTSSELTKEDAAQQDVHQDIKKVLCKDHACYVLITCKSPDNGGEMQVEMSYQGDTALASYLLEGAQTYLEDEE